MYFKTNACVILRVLKKWNEYFLSAKPWFVGKQISARVHSSIFTRHLILKVHKHSSMYYHIINSWNNAPWRIKSGLQRKVSSEKSSLRYYTMLCSLLISVHYNCENPRKYKKREYHFTSTKLKTIWSARSGPQVNAEDCNMESRHSKH